MSKKVRVMMKVKVNPPSKKDEGVIVAETSTLLMAAMVCKDMKGSIIGFRLEDDHRKVNGKDVGHLGIYIYDKNFKELEVLAEGIDIIKNKSGIFCVENKKLLPRVEELTEKLGHTAPIKVIFRDDEIIVGKAENDPLFFDVIKKRKWDR